MLESLAGAAQPEPHWLPLGALVNAAAVLAGGAIGLLLHRALPDGLRRAAFTATGLCTLLIGMQMALKTSNLLAVIFAMILGSVIGEALDLQGRLEQLSETLKARLGRERGASDGADPGASARSKSSRFTDGLITAFLIYCVGSMTIVGSLQEGMTGDASLIYAKSLLDGFTSIALASTYGVGVLFSALPLLLIQSLLTWLGAGAGSAVGPGMVAQLTAVGGLLVLALGINILELAKLKVANLLPALLMVVLIEIVLGLL
jgi:uncharacterized membrane protein YqgA involved in biofilm formation